MLHRYKYQFELDNKQDNRVYCKCNILGWKYPMYKGAPLPRPKAAILIFSISASCSLFALARRFWNQIFTWVSVSLSDDENSARSAILRYCFSRNFFSSDSSCCVVNGVLGLRFGLCFLKLHFILGGSLLSVIKKKRKTLMTFFFSYKICRYYK